MTRVIYCDHCLDYLKSCGYKIYTGSSIDFDKVESGARCQFCLNEDYEDINDIELIECYEEE